MDVLITLCDGCHAAHHPKLAGGLARRAVERWAVRLARAPVNVGRRAWQLALSLVLAFQRTQACDEFVD